MRFNFESPVVDFVGNPILDNGKPVLLRDTIISALLVAEQEMEPHKKFYRYMLAQKVFKGDEVSVEDVAEIKAAIGKHGVPMVVGQVWQLLEA